MGTDNVVNLCGCTVQVMLQSPREHSAAPLLVTLVIVSHFILVIRVDIYSLSSFNFLITDDVNGPIYFSKFTKYELIQSPRSNIKIILKLCEIKIVYFVTEFVNSHLSYKAKFLSFVVFFCPLPRGVLLANQHFSALTHVCLVG